jgi:hypothetical protein
MATVMFDSTDGFPPPPPEVKQRRATGGATTTASRPSGGVADTLGGLLD